MAREQLALHSGLSAQPARHCLDGRSAYTDLDVAIAVASGKGGLSVSILEEHSIHRFRGRRSKDIATGQVLCVAGNSSLVCAATVSLHSSEGHIVQRRTATLPF